MSALRRKSGIFLAAAALFMWATAERAEAQNLRSGQQRAPSALRAGRPGAAMRPAMSRGLGSRGPSMMQRPMSSVGGGSQAARASGRTSYMRSGMQNRPVHRSFIGGTSHVGSRRPGIGAGSTHIGHRGSHSGDHVGIVRPGIRRNADFHGSVFHDRRLHSGHGSVFHDRTFHHQHGIGFHDKSCKATLFVPPLTVLPGFYGGFYGYPYPYGGYASWPYGTYNDEYFSTDEIAVEALENPVTLEWPGDYQADDEAYDASLRADALRKFRMEREAEAEAAREAEEAKAAPSPDDAKREALVAEAVARGDGAFEAGAYDLAREEYVRALVQAGEDPGVRIALGLAEYALGSYRDAAAAIRRGLSGSSALARSDFDLRAAYGVRGDAEAHRIALEDYVAQRPGDGDALMLLGFIRYFSGEKAAGAGTLKEYLAMEGHDPAMQSFIEAAAWETGQSPAWDR